MTKISEINTQNQSKGMLLAATPLHELKSTTAPSAPNVLPQDLANLSQSLSWFITQKTFNTFRIIDLSPLELQRSNGTVLSSFVQQP